MLVTCSLINDNLPKDSVFVQGSGCNCSTCLSGSITLCFVLKHNYQNMEKLQQNLSALSWPVVILQTNVIYDFNEEYLQCMEGKWGGTTLQILINNLE